MSKLKDKVAIVTGASKGIVIGQPRDIAPAAVFLASDEAALITGETLLVAGGLR